jgi:hypothetical protein
LTQLDVGAQSLGLGIDGGGGAAQDRVEWGEAV